MNITIRDDKKIEIEMKDQLLEAIDIIHYKITVHCGFLTFQTTYTPYKWICRRFKRK